MDDATLKNQEEQGEPEVQAEVKPHDHQEVEWAVGHRGDAPPEKVKIEHIPTIKSSGEGDEETVRLWNLMVKTLKDNGLMKAK